MTKRFILDLKKIGKETVRIGNTSYKLQVGDINSTFHIIPDNSESEAIDLSPNDLKALYLLLTTDDGE